MKKPSIYLFSGPCGCGKSTLSEAFAKHLVNDGVEKQVYLLHGDDFHAGFIETDDKGALFVDGQAANVLEWEEILRFNWDCLIDVAGKALLRGLSVVIDYVVEDELPLVQALAKRHGAALYYVAITASPEALDARIRSRGDIDLLERAQFLRRKLAQMPENQGHLFDNTGLTVQQEIEQLDIERFLVEP